MGPMAIGQRIQRERQALGLSLQRLARHAGVSAAAISKIERNGMVPSIAVLMKLASALNRTVGYLVGEEDGEAPRHVELIRAQGREKLHNEESAITSERVAGRLHDSLMIAGISRIAPGGASGDGTMTHRGEELALCLDGEIEYTVAGKSYRLGKGDSFHFKSHLSHRWRNPGRRRARVLYVLVRPVPE